MKRAGSLKQAVLAGFAFLAAVAAQSGATQGGAPPVLEDVRLLELPDELAAVPADVRWQEDGSLLLGLRRDGIYSWFPETGRIEAVATLSGSTWWRAGRYGDYSRLGGWAAGTLIFAGDLFGVYRQRGGRITALKANLEIVGDLDQRDGTAVAVGLARQPKPSPGPDDIWEPYIAWLIDTEGGTRGLLPTRDGGRALDSCYPVELSVSRFVTDRLVLVIPGAEPGVYLYGTDGALRGIVDSEALSITRPDCSSELKPLLDDEAGRTEWLGRHRLIDEVAANGEGDVFFFVRHVVDDESVLPAPASGTSERPRAVARELPDVPTAVRDSDVEQVAEALDGAGDARGVSRVAALGLGDVDDPELKKLLQDGASQDGPLVVTGEQAERILAALNLERTQAKASAVPATSAASVPSAKVCWDIVHLRTNDLQSTSSAPCAVSSDRADARLRADLSGDRAVFLLRGATRLAQGDVDRPAKVFLARLRSGSQ